MIPRTNSGGCILSARAHDLYDVGLIILRPISTCDINVQGRASTRAAKSRWDKPVRSRCAFIHLPPSHLSSRILIVRLVRGGLLLIIPYPSTATSGLPDRSHLHHHCPPYVKPSCERYCRPDRPRKAARPRCFNWGRPSVIRHTPGRSQVCRV